VIGFIGAFLGGLLRGLFEPLLKWFHDSAVRQQAIVDTLSDVKRHEAEALEAAVKEVKHVSETIDRQSRADTDAVLDELYRARHPEAFRQ
jgi:hypothetical protein